MVSKAQRSGTDIHSNQFVQGLFDEMSATYGRANIVSSFGFCVRWRKKCVQQIDIKAGDAVIDLMSGMGELWPSITEKVRSSGEIKAIDFSPVMCEKSRVAAERLDKFDIQILQEDALKNSLPDESADVVVSTFGLKTLTKEQCKQLAKEVFRILKPGGKLSLLEISVPRFRPLRLVYMFYLKYIVPLFGQMLLGNPENYRMLGKYTEKFGDCSYFGESCSNAGLKVITRKFFFGCATAVVGQKLQ